MPQSDKTPHVSLWSEVTDQSCGAAVTTNILVSYSLLHLTDLPMKQLGVALIGIFGTASTLEASTMLHTLNPQAYRDEATFYPMVGQVIPGPGEIGLNGSGVLISNQWVLTAGHISQSKQAGDVFKVGGVDYTIASTVTHPDYLSAGANSYDLGLLYLSAPVTTASPTQMFRYGTPTSIIGKEATYIGVGFTGTGITGAQSSLIELRAFTNLIEFYGEQYFLSNTSFVSDFDNDDGTINRADSIAADTRLEGSLAPGDSGGGVFVTEGDVRYLIGINSYSGFVNPAGMDSKYGGISGATDLQQFYPWIFSETGISAVPEPGVLWLCTLGGLLGMVRRR